MKRALNHPEWWLALAAMGIVLALLVGQIVQLRSVPTTLRHVPIESDAFLVTAPLGDLWRGLQPHLGGYFDEAAAGDEPSVWRSAALELKRDLQKKAIALRQPEDLAGVGVDVHAAAATALLRQGDALHPLVVLPLIDRGKFLQALQTYLERAPVAIEGQHPEILRFGRVVVAFADDGTALLSDSDVVLQRVLDGPDRRLAHFRSSDRFGRAFTAPLPRTAQTPTAWLRGRLYLPDPLPAGAEMHFALATDDSSMAFEGRAAVAPARSQLVATLLRPEPADAADTTLPRSDLALSLASASVLGLIRELSALLDNAGIRPLAGRFAPVIAELRRGDNLQRLSVAVSDANQRVPGFVLGLQMPAADADAFVLRVQTALRINRDGDILRSASARLREAQGGGAVPGLQALIDNDQIKPEEGALWHRYRWPGTAVEPKTALTKQDFSSYERPAADGSLRRYLMPPFNDNDIAHRFHDSRDSLQLDQLRADRYRLCSTYRQGALWIGNDAIVLDAWIARLQRDPPSTNFQDAAVLSRAAAQAKVLVLAQPAHLLQAGQLYPDNEVNTMSRQWLVDLAAYRATLLGLSADARAQELHVWATFLRR